jgi:hypothetical protein
MGHNPKTLKAPKNVTTRPLNLKIPLDLAINNKINKRPLKPSPNPLRPTRLPLLRQSLRPPIHNPGNLNNNPKNPAQPFPTRPLPKAPQPRPPLTLQRF